jgi:hypothetical protein
MSDFFVGYLPAPPGLQRFLRRTVASLFAAAAGIGGALLLGQQPFPSAVFEYGVVRPFEGTIAADPYPRLIAQDGRSFLLVSPGKHGAEELAREFEGAAVRFNAQRIYREETTMLEVLPGSIQRQRAGEQPRERMRELGEITRTGEIVDSKCWLGVMNPGAGKVHRDCAARCLSGGVPPMFVTTGDGEQFLLVDNLLRPFTRDALRPFTAERITLRGTAFQNGDQQLLAIDPAALRHQALPNS